MKYCPVCSNHLTKRRSEKKQYAEGTWHCVHCNTTFFILETSIDRVRHKELFYV